MKGKVARKVGIIILFAGIIMATFFATKAHYYKRGLIGQSGIQALEQVAINHLYKRLLDDERYIDLDEQVELNMWLAIPALYESTKNQDASKGEQKAGTRILSEAVKYFYMNPRIVKVPESLDLNDDTQKIILTKIKQEDIEDDLANTLQNIAPLLKVPLDGLSGQLNNIILQMYFDELKSQAVFNSLVKQRYFPGKERKADGITVMTPRGTGSWLGSGLGSKAGEFEFEYEKPELKVRYDRGKLSVNGEDYGGLNKDDIIDFRVPDRVYVNDQERKPQH